MTTLTPTQMRRIARDLMNDAVNGREDGASRNDGEILARFAETGTATRAGLDAALDEIERSALPLARKKEALRVLERYKEQTATGFASELFSADEELLRRLAFHGVDDPAKLLAAGATTAKREHLAHQVGSSEAELRRLVKQVDLMRVSGVDPKTAHVLLAAGVDSVPELAQRNAASLQRALAEYAGSHEGYVVGFRAPAADEVERWVEQAKTLERKVDFGTFEQSLASLSLAERIDLYVDHSDLLSFRDDDKGLIRLLGDLGVPEAMSAIGAMRKEAAATLASELEDVWDTEVPATVIEGLDDYDALLTWVADHVGADEADALGNGWADWKQPEIEVIKSGRETVGAKITFSRNLDGDHDYFTSYYVDALEKRIVAVATGGYEINTDVDEVDAGDPLSGASVPD